MFTRCLKVYRLNWKSVAFHWKMSIRVKVAANHVELFQPGWRKMYPIAKPFEIKKRGKNGRMFCNLHLYTYCRAYGCFFLFRCFDFIHWLEVSTPWFYIPSTMARKVFRKKKNPYLTAATLMRIIKVSCFFSFLFFLVVAYLFR